MICVMDCTMVNHRNYPPFGILVMLFYFFLQHFQVANPSFSHVGEIQQTQPQIDGSEGGSGLLLGANVCKCCFTPKGHSSSNPSVSGAMRMFPKIMVPPNHPFLIGFSIVNHSFWGTLFLETPMLVSSPLRYWE